MSSLLKKIQPGPPQGGRPQYYNNNLHKKSTPDQHQPTKEHQMSPESITHAPMATPINSSEITTSKHPTGPEFNLNTTTFSTDKTIAMRHRESNHALSAFQLA